MRVRSYPHFYGGASERRPWALKRDDRPKGVPNCVLPLPTAPEKPVKKVRNSPENNLRILRGKIVTRYRRVAVASMTIWLWLCRWGAGWRGAGRLG